MHFHAIGYKTLYNIVLENIRRQAECASVQKEKYLEMLKNQMAEKATQDINQSKVKLKKINKRIAQLEKILNNSMRTEP